MSADAIEQPNRIELPSIDDSTSRDLPSNIQQQNVKLNPENLSPAQETQNNSLISTQLPQSQQQIQQANLTDDNQTNQQIQSVVQSPAIADDVDLIEKEWVVKAKEIVEKTRDNPYLQNKAIGEMKTDYIKKRYNMDISNNSE